MPLPKQLTAYAHVKQILDAALHHNKAIFTLPTPSAAVRWRQEAYYFRRLSQQQGIDIYNNFMLRLDGVKVIIEKRSIPGTLTTESGEPIDPAATTQDDTLERAAFDLAKQLGLEVDDD